MLPFLVGVASTTPSWSTSSDPAAGALLAEEACVAKEVMLDLLDTPSKDFRFDAVLSTDWNDDVLAGVAREECLLDADPDAAAWPSASLARSSPIKLARARFLLLAVSLTATDGTELIRAGLALKVRLRCFSSSSCRAFSSSFSLLRREIASPGSSNVGRVGALVDFAGTNPGLDVLRLLGSTRGVSFFAVGVLTSFAVAVGVADFSAFFVKADAVVASLFSGFLGDPVRAGVAAA